MDFIPHKKAKSVEKVMVSIRLDAKKLEKIDTLANEVGISRNELINQCIEYSIKSNMESTEKNKPV